MINIIKKYLMILSCLLFLICLSSCHGDKYTEDAIDTSQTVMSSDFIVPSEFDLSKKYEIVFWAKNDNNNTQKAIYANAIEEFQKIYPNITIKLSSYNDYKKIYNDVITNIATNTTPNLAISYPDHVATYLTGNDIVVPLDNLFDDEKYGLGGSEVLFDSPRKDELVASFLEECYFNDHYYSMPYMRSTEACYVNKDYVESLGFTLPEVLTWDFIWEVSRKAMSQKEDSKVLIPVIYKSTDNMMIQMLKQKNAGYSLPTGEVELFNDTTKEILYEIASAVKDGCFSTFSISSYPGNFFNAGECIFAIDSTAGSTWIGTEAPLVEIPEDKLVQFETEVMTVPQYDIDKPQMISQGPSICLFNKEDKSEVLAAWLFMQYLLTNDVQIAYSKTEGYVPVTSKALESDTYQDYLSKEGLDDKEYYYVKIRAAKLLLNNIDNTFVTPVFNGSASVRDAAGHLIEEVAKTIRRRGEVNERYLGDLYKSTSSLYRLDQKDDLGKLPTASIVLISVLASIWIMFGGYFCYNYFKNKKTQTKN